MSTTVTVTPAMGGIVEVEGATLDVPAGAVPGDVEITVTSTTERPPTGFTTWSSPVYKFGPDGLVFLMPVQVTLTFTGEPTEPTVMWSLPDGGFENRGGTVSGKNITTTVLHFSEGFVVPAPGPNDPDAGTFVPPDTNRDGGPNGGDGGPVGPPDGGTGGHDSGTGGGPDGGTGGGPDGGVSPDGGPLFPPDGGVPPDGGTGGPDGGTGGGPDGGTNPDGGMNPDGGPVGPPDGGTGGGPDGGTGGGPDGGMNPDGGPVGPPDGGVAPDGGVKPDGGPTPDGGVAPDGGAGPQTPP